MISTAATLHAQGKTDITTAADAAEALRPIAGDLAFASSSQDHRDGPFVSSRISWFSSVCVRRISGLERGLENKPWEAVGFRPRNRRCNHPRNWD